MYKRQLLTRRTQQNLKVTSCYTGNRMAFVIYRHFGYVHYTGLNCLDMTAK